MFWENAAEYLRHSECYNFQTFAIVFSTPWNLLVGITGALEQKKGTFSAKTCFEKMLWGISEMVGAIACKPLSLCSAPLKTY